jgi:hypothetical protein
MYYGSNNTASTTHKSHKSLSGGNMLTVKLSGVGLETYKRYDDLTCRSFQ